MASTKGVGNIYKTLEVAEEADEDTVKKSYRKLVLKWHPDKNPTDREKAEEQIRSINAAYAILSNPTKREKYDLQRGAIHRKQRGMAPAKPRVFSKLSIPKEFLLQPLGHTEKFTRYEGKRTSVVGRGDSDAKFKDFFETAKFSLWWVPEVNNKCRIRAMGSKGVGDKRGASSGLAGGLNLSFRVAADAESEVLLAAAEKGKKTTNVDFMVKESPVEGAFRFETACRRGHYLAFNPPCDLRVAPLLQEDEGRVLDFMLVDFSVSVKYKDLDEVLRPLAEPKEGGWMPLAELRQAKEVAAYFKKVMKLDEVWAVEDFAAHFEGHFVDWDFKPTTNEVRLRSKEERLGQILRSAKAADEVSLTLLSAGEELGKVPLPGLLRAIKVMARAKEKHQEKGKGKNDEGEVERLKLLRALPDALAASVKTMEAETELPLGRATVQEILDGAEAVPALVCTDPLPDILEHRKEAIKTLVELAVARLGKDSALSGQPVELSAEDLLRLLRLHGAAVHDAAMSKHCVAPLESFDRKSSLQVLQRAFTMGCQNVAAAAAGAVLRGLGEGGPDEAATAIVSLAQAGAPLEPLAAMLLERADSTAAAALAPAIVALCDRGLAASPTAALLDRLVGKGPLPSALPHTVLLGLALAAAKEPEALQAAFGPLAAAAGTEEAGLGAWPGADVVRLLLAMVKGRGNLEEETKKALLGASAVALAQRLGDLSSADFVKLLLAVAGFGASALLDVVVKEAVFRFSDLSLPHLLLVTQGLAQGLEPSHTTLQAVLEFWPPKLKLPNTTAAAAGSAAAAAALPLTAELVVKLVVALSPTLKAVGGHRKFVEAACSLLLVAAQQLCDGSRDLLRAELAPGGFLADFSRCGQLLTALAKKPKRGRSPSPGATHHGHLKSRTNPGKKKQRR